MTYKVQVTDLSLRYISLVSHPFIRHFRVIVEKDIFFVKQKVQRKAQHGEALAKWAFRIKVR